MKLFVALCALIAVAAAQVSNEYLPPNYGGDVAPAEQSYTVAAPAPVVSYETAASAPAHSYSSAEGYRYKTNRRRVVRRHRRDVSLDYLPPAASTPVNSYLAPAASAPVESYTVAASAPAVSYETYETAAAAPAHSYSDAEGYRYRTARRRVLRRHRRDVSLDYLPPAASTPVNSYLAPAASAPVESYTVAASAPAVSYETYETAAATPAHSYSDAEGYRYRTARRRVLRRHRRDVSLDYLPPAASTPVNSYLAPAASAPVESYTVAASAPAPAVSYETYETAAAAPAHSYSDAEGYRYRTARRRVLRRHRRDVSLDYLPPAASTPVNSYLAPAASAPVESYTVAASAPAPAVSYETYETAADAPAHSYSDAEGYRYRTARRRVLRRHRRDVSLDYLPPAASTPVNSYLAPAASAPVESYTVAASAPAPAVSYETYETAAAAPAHSYSDAEGYRYRTARRRVLRRHRY